MDITPRLFTARYSNKTLAEHAGAKVRITLGHPRFKLPGYQLAATIHEVAPERSMFGKSDADFTRLYEALLEHRSVDRLAALFDAVAHAAGTDQLVLLCFEDLRKPGLFCHRRTFAAWWEARTSQVVDELPERAEARPETVQATLSLDPTNP